MAPRECSDGCQPVIDDAVAKVFEGGFDAAAAVVAADDDVADFENIDGVLEDGEHIEIVFLDDVRDVAVDEDLTWRKPGDLVGRNPGVRASDPEVAGILLICEAFEKIRIVGPDFFSPERIVFDELVDAVHED